MEVRSESSGDSGKFVINVGASNAPRHDAITNILDLLESRYKLAETVLFHRTKLSVIALLDRCLIEIRNLYRSICHGKNWERDLKELLLQELMCGSDDALPDILRRVAFGTNADHPYVKAEAEEERAERSILQSSRGAAHMEDDGQRQPALLSTEEEDPAETTSLSLGECRELIEQLIDGLQDREIFTRVYRFGRFDLTGADTEEKQRRIIELYEKPDNRANFLINLEILCNLPAGSVAMCCSSDPKMNAKIAEVDLLIDDHIKSFTAYEHDAGDDGLTGGALNSQIRRFQALWSAEVYMRKEVWHQLDGTARQDFQQLIKETFLPYGGLSGIRDICHYRDTMQFRVDNVRGKFERYAARSGTKYPRNRDFLEKTFPNGMPCANSSNDA